MLKRYRLRVKKSDLECLFLVLYFAISPISKLLEKLWLPRPITYIFLIILGVVFLAKRFRYLIKKSDVIVAFFILTFIVLFAVIFHHEDFNSETEMYAMLIIFFPAYFIMRVASLDKLVLSLRIYAYIGLAVFLPNAFLVQNVNHDYISFAYDLLLPICIIVYYAEKNRHWVDIVLSIIGVIILAIFGSRGSVIALAFFYIFINIERKKTKKIILLLSISFLVYIAFLNLPKIIMWLESFGISSYALNRIANNEAFTSITRLMLFEYIITKLLPYNYFGYGPMGNRALMPIIRYQMPYPHQLFLEILIDYGLIIGSFFSAAIIAVVLYLVLKTKDDYRYLCGLFCVASFFPLMISGTFYTVGTIPYIFAVYSKFREEKRKIKKKCQMVS